MYGIESHNGKHILHSPYVCLMYKCLILLYCSWCADVSIDIGELSLSHKEDNTDRLHKEIQDVAWEILSFKFLLVIVCVQCDGLSNKPVQTCN